jgi:hypothetical protein
MTLKSAWADGTRHLLFEPLELLEKLAALMPRPRINLVLYHGILAPHARWHARVVIYGAVAAARLLPPSLPDSREEDGDAEPTHRHWSLSHGIVTCSGPRSRGCLLEYPNAGREWTWQWLFPATQSYQEEDCT